MKAPIYGLMLLALSGCPETKQEYRITPHVNRPPIVDTPKGWKSLYESIDNKVLTPEEAEFVKHFRHLPGEEQKRLLADPLLNNFGFLNINNPGMRDIVLLYYIDMYLRENIKELKGIK